MLRNFAALTRNQEIEIGGASFACVTEFAETHLVRLYAFGKRQEGELVRRTYRSGRIRTQERTCSQQWVLPANPKPSATDFTIRNPMQVRAKEPANRLE